MAGKLVGLVVGESEAQEPHYRSTRSSLVTRNVYIGRKRTSVRLEPELWNALGVICARKGESINAVCTRLDRDRTIGGMTSALRVYIVVSLQEMMLNDGN